MSSDVGRAVFRIAVFITLVSGALLLFQKPGTAEFVVTVTSLAIGIVFLLIVVVLVRRSNH